MNYMIKNHEIVLLDEDGNEIGTLCEEAAILRKEINLLNNLYNVVIRVWAKAGPSDKRYARSVLDHRVTPYLLNQGLKILEEEENNRVVQAALLESENDAEEVYKHDLLGFHTLKEGDTEKEVFLLYKPIGADSGTAKADSTYFQPGRLKPKGTLDGWLDVVNEEVVGHPNMELALSLGATGPIVHILREENEISDLPIYMLVGRTSTGKSGALKLGCSLTGRPTEAGGMLLNMNSTENAFFERVAQSQGCSVFCDEVQAQGSSIDMTSLCYPISKGEQRARCNSDGSLKEQREFSGSFIMTGEHSILSDEVTGGNARILQLRLHWTDDEKHARRLERGIRKNYGVAAESWLLWVMEHKEDIVDSFVRTLDCLEDHYHNESNVFKRLLKMVTIVLVAADTLQTVFGLEFDLQKMQEILIDACRANLPELSMGDRAYNALMTFILKNRSDFPWDSAIKGKTAIAYGIKGCKITKQGCTYVHISADEFESCLQKAGIPDAVEAARALHSSKRILKYGDKYRKAQTIGGISVICYTVLLTADTDESIKKREELEAKKKAAAEQRKLREEKRKAQQEALLAEDDDDFEFDEFDDEEVDTVTTDSTAVVE